MAEQALPDRIAQAAKVGGRLRVRREEVGISLRELARRIGVSPSLVSQIERDLVTPSVSTLYAIVMELGLTMGDVFAEGPAAGGRASALTAVAVDPATEPESRRVINLAAGVQWERLTATNDAFVEFLRVVYEVGGESCPADALMRHAGREYGYVISGRLGVTVGFDEYELGPGGAISFDSSSPHRLRTIGDEPVAAIWAVVGRQADARAPGAP